jgi:serine/threonine protein kinase
MCGEWHFATASPRLSASRLFVEIRSGIDVTSSHHSSHGSSQSSQQSASGAVEARQKAGERLGQWVKRKYRLEALLGVGGMATVYAARHRNGARVALKIMHTEFAREEGVKTRFLREGYVANKVDHPGVVRILDDDETDQGEPYLVMELLEGETLQQLWKRRDRMVPPVEALVISEQILDTLHPFHELNIIHRDLKPANIFICQDGNVKLLDFGVAQMREGGEAMTRAGTALGTPSFMSPEQAMGKSDQLDGRSDIFSVGATLYAILSGQRLHHGKSDNEAFILAATQPAPSLARVAPELPTDVIAFVDRALQWDRRKRYKTASEMREECVKLLGSLGAAPRQRTDTSDGGRAAPEPPPAADPPPAGARNVPAERRGPPQGTPLGTPYTPGIPAQVPRFSPSVAPSPFTPHSGISPTLTPTSGERSMGPQGQQAHGARPSQPQVRGSMPSLPAMAVEPSEPPPAVKEAPPQAPEALLGVFERLEKSLATFRQYGLDHPEGQTRLKAIYRAVVDALREDPEMVRWQVHPFCFTHGRAVAWEPTPPFDLVPYNLASSGLEEVQIFAGITEEELTAFVRAMLLDPTSDTDHDIAAALWEARFMFIRCRIRDDLAEADAAEQMRFYTETDDLEAMAREDLAEVAAMAVATDKGSFAAAKAASAALDLDPATKAALGTQVSLDPERWRERFFDLAVDALTDAQSRQDAATFLEPISGHGWILAKRQRFEQLFRLHRVLLERLASHREARRYGVSPGLITRALFPARVLCELVRAAVAPATPQHQRQHVIAGLKLALEHSEGEAAIDLLLTANEVKLTSETEEANAVFELCVAYAEAHAKGRETQMVEVLDRLAPDLAQRMLGALTASRSAQAIALLKPLLASNNPALRCEATALLSDSPDTLGKQLAHMLTTGDAPMRAAALSTTLRHPVVTAGPALVRVIESDEFRQRSAEEQEQMLDTLYALNARRAEQVLVKLLNDHGTVLADDRIERTRIAAAKVLGRRADSTAPLDALENATRRRPWNTQTLRVAAGAAAEAIGARLRGGLAASGGGNP